MTWLIGFRDTSNEYTPQEIKERLEQAGFVHNSVYNRMRFYSGDSPVLAMEYFTPQNVVALYAYHTEIRINIPGAMKVIKKALPRFQPELVGIGSGERDGSKVKFKGSGRLGRVEDEITSLLG